MEALHAELHDTLCPKAIAIAFLGVVVIDYFSIGWLGSLGKVAALVGSVAAAVFSQWPAPLDDGDAYLALGPFY
jgi:hypothetical protein